MTRILSSLTIVAFFAGIVLVGTSFGQLDVQWKGSGGWGPSSNYNRLYNLTTVETFTGQVAAIDFIVPETGMFQGISLLVDAGRERIPVHLGPRWFIENQDIAFRPGDRVEVRGSRVSFDGRPAVIAAVVRSGPEVLRLRDEKGYPVWSALVPR